MLAGILIGPFALGAVDLPLIGPLFPPGPVAGGLGVPEPLWLVGQLGAVLLLFGAGLDTDFGTFVRFAPSALAVAAGGVVLPFVLGDVIAVAAGFATGPLDPRALFFGAILTATSVGVTARVLGDIGKLDTPEGATILGAAVIDVIIGVLVLALVVGASGGTGAGVAELGLLGLRTVGLWLAFSALLLVLAIPFGRVMRGLRTSGAALGLAVAVALLSGYAAEGMGLAMIIGSYSAGLALSRSNLRRQLASEIRAVQHALVPVFFVTMGMLVDVSALAPILAFGLGLTIIAALGKIIGCGVPALLTGFNRVGALRVGMGMVPRGEVALVVAGLGLAHGTIDTSLFGVAVLVAVLTTVITPLPLARAFRLPGWGTRAADVRSGQAGTLHSLTLSAGLGDIFERHLVGSLADHGYLPVGTWSDSHGTRGLELRRDDQILSVVLRDDPDGRRRLELEAETPVGDLASILGRAADGTADEVAAALRDAREPLVPGAPSARTAVP